MKRVWVKPHSRKGKTVKGHYKNISGSKRGFAQISSKANSNLTDKRFGIDISKEALQEFLDDPLTEATTVGIDSEGYSKVAYKDDGGAYIHLNREEVTKNKLQNKVIISDGKDFGKEYKFYIYNK